MEWISIRHQWPLEKGEYEVYDCRHEMDGVAFYNGYDWKEFRVNKPVLKGHLMYMDYLVTHWKNIPEPPKENELNLLTEEK